MRARIGCSSRSIDRGSCGFRGWLYPRHRRNPRLKTCGSFVAALLVCASVHAAETFGHFDRAAALAEALGPREHQDVFVAAHRSDWRSAPENSLPAIRSALAMGVDIIEVDVRRTKDGRFVVIHDRTIDRTMTGKGLVADKTLEELRALKLRDGAGNPTAEVIPTLEEALREIRGRALVNLDKSDEHAAEICAVVEREGALGFALFSVTQSLSVYESLYPGLLAKIKFMLVVSPDRPGGRALIEEYLAQRPPLIVQIVFAREDDPALALVPAIRARGIRVWCNALWPHHSAGHHDDRALTDPEGAWGWLIAHGASILQTDRPQLLLEYLRRKSLRR
jgi:glycerophosphoryl diester phosphodiesterase